MKVGIIKSFPVTLNLGHSHQDVFETNAQNSFPLGFDAQ